uniref:Uncharacterized protein n=1 Tax=Kalanchoe fedtschenkoi TaxID=63787 RepID=A0A7N0V3Q5_KALFE
MFNGAIGCKVLRGACPNLSCQRLTDIVIIKLVAPPLYVLTTQTLDKEQGISVLSKAITACTEEIELHKGKLVVKEAPRAVSERDDKLLADHMAKLREANEEISGDEDSEEEEDTGMGDIDVENAGAMAD